MQKNKKIIYTCLGSILCLLLITAYIYIYNNLNNEEFIPTNYDFTIVADSYSSAGVDLDTGFIITSKEDFNLANVEEIIKVSPDIKYDLSKSGAGSYYLKPEENLSENSIFNIYIDADENTPENSWAFQTKASFKVLSSLPANTAIVDNLNTGIQLNFSKNIKNIDDFFSISPKIDGKFVYTGKSVTFVPSKKLKNKENYLVTIKSGLESIDGEILEEDYNFSFKTEEHIYSSNDIFVREKNITYNTKNTHMTSLIYGLNKYEGVDFDVSIYDLVSSENYLKLLKIENELIDVEKYSLMTNFKANLMYPENDYYNTGFIVYPENLPVGWYLVDIKTAKNSNINSEQHLQQLVQVSDISVYMQSMNGQALIWSNDCTTGLPLADVEIKVGNNTTKTNENGVAIFKVSGKQQVEINAKDDKKFVNIMNFDANWEETKYNIYLFTDREAYQPTDKINFWGMIVPQASDYKLPKELDLYFNMDELVLENIPVNSSGIFSGSLDIENRISEYISLIIKFDNDEYYAKEINIEEFTKPTYVLDFNFDKEYYKKNEVASISIEGNYFDGNPANNLQLNLGIESSTEAIVLDNNGKENIKYSFNNINRNSWYPETIYASLYTSGADEHAFKDKTILYFPTDYMLNTEMANNELIISTNIINYNSVTINNFDYEKIKGKPQAGVNGQIKFYRNDYIKKQVGTYYDFINKVNKPKYEYKIEKYLVDIVDFTTDFNGISKIKMNYQNTEDYYFTYEIEYNMPDDFSGFQNGIIGNYSYRNDYVEYYYFDTGYKQLRTNEEILVKVESNKEFENKGKVLYVIRNDDIQEAAITQNDQFTLKYNEYYVPNVLLTGAYFDGTNIHEINSTYLISNLEEKKLNIQITNDKESYAPGEDVTINIEAKDMNGKSAKTNMVIAVVDEAAFAVSEQNEEPLESLYSFDYYNPVTYFSYNSDMIDAEGGAGGGEEIGSYRDFFKDTVAFLTIKTGSNGKTSASFKLPDNITSWRITVVGITDSLNAGVGKTNIVSTLPFYTNVVMNSKYNIQDDISFSLKSAGEYLPLLSNSIQYNINLFKDDELVISEKAYQLPYKSVNINMGKVAETGKYKLEIKSECGIYKDTIVKEFSVVNSLHEINISKTIDLQNLAEMSAVKYPITLSIYDINNKMYYDIVSKILNTSLGTTSDQKIAYNILVKKLNELNKESYLLEKDINQIQDYDGGVRLLEYAASDPLLTAKICALAPEKIDQHRVINYFENIISNQGSDISEISAAYFGLASLKRPVLNDIKYILQNNKELSTADGLNLIGGLAYIGDTLVATEWYQKLIEPKLNVNIEEEMKYLRLDNSYESYSQTSFLAMVLAKINNEDFSMVVNYILKNDSNEYTPALDLAEYIKSYNPQNNSIGYIKYNYNNEEFIKDFKDNSILTMQLDEKKIKKINVIEANNVIGKVEYVGSIEDAVDNYNNNIKIIKTIDGGDNIGDLQIVTLTIKMPNVKNDNEYFIVNDIIPTGMRFVGVEEFYNYKNDGQKVRFYIRNNKNKTEYTIQYNVRNVLEGEYALESAIVLNPQTREIGYTEQNTVIIE